MGAISTTHGRPTTKARGSGMSIEQEVAARALINKSNSERKKKQLFLTHSRITDSLRRNRGKFKQITVRTSRFLGL